MLLTPHFLYYLFGLLMLAVAAYSILLLVVSAVSRRPAGVDVETSHVVMGVAMAGMFVDHWAFGPDVVWELVFGVLLVWFVARGIQSIQAFGLHLPHTFVHGLMSFAMLTMYWFPMARTAGRSMGMAMTAGTGGGRVDPALPFAIALALCASAVFTLASPKKGAAVYGTHVRPVEPDGAAPTAPDAYLAAAPSSAGGADAVIAAPRLVDATHVVMCVAMAFMLILML